MKKAKASSFKWKPLSTKQLKVLTWWRSGPPVKDRDAIICNGSVRAGKTVVMSFSFVAWAMDTFDGENLGMAGKTIGALRRNVLQPLKRILKGRGYKCKDHRADNFLTITYKGKTNYFYLFGGKDEASQDLIQGITPGMVRIIRDFIYATHGEHWYKIRLSDFKLVTSFFIGNIAAIASNSTFYVLTTSRIKRVRSMYKIL